MKTGDIIKQLRKDKNLSQQTLADELKISRSTLACYETNRNQIPNELLVIFSKYFDVSTDYLLGLED